MAVLHKALGDGRGVKRYIANHVGRGYAFVAPVTRKYPSAAADPPNGASEGNDAGPRSHASSAATMSSSHWRHSLLAIAS